MDFSLLFGEELDTVNDSPIWNVSNLLADDGRPVGELASSELEVKTPARTAPSVLPPNVRPSVTDSDSTDGMHRTGPAHTTLCNRSGTAT